MREFLFFTDFSELYPIWEKVVREYCLKFGSDFSNRLLLYIPHDANAEENLARLDKLVYSVLQGKEDNIVIQLGGIDDEAKLFEGADIYITSRALRTVRRSCMADLYGVRTISGVDEPLFSDL